MSLSAVDHGLLRIRTVLILEGDLRTLQAFFGLLSPRAS